MAPYSLRPGRYGRGNAFAVAPQLTTMTLHPDDVATVVLGRLTLGLFAVLGVVVALAEWQVLPRDALVVGAPALVAALLLDTFLYNEFLIRTGGWIWVEIYAFLYVEAVVAAAVVTRLRPLWRDHVATGD